METASLCEANEKSFGVGRTLDVSYRKSEASEKRKRGGRAEDEKYKQSSSRREE